jgi:hypothetical protein
MMIQLNYKLTNIVQSVDKSLIQMLPLVKDYPVFIKISTNEFSNSGNIKIPPFLEIIPLPFEVDYNPNTTIILQVENIMFKLKISNLKQRNEQLTNKISKLRKSYYTEFLIS